MKLRGKSTRRCASPSILLLIGCFAWPEGEPLSAEAAPKDWRLVFQEDFGKAEWQKRWRVKGELGPQDKGELLTGSGEVLAIIQKQFVSPAIRVNYDARMLDKSICDLSCLVGKEPGTADRYCGFMFAGEYNTLSRIVSPGQEDITSLKGVAEKGKSYQVTAELNGRVATLLVDGKVVLRKLLRKPIPGPYKVCLYTWEGAAAFDNVRIFVKAKADSIPAELLKERQPVSTETKQETVWIRDLKLPPIRSEKKAVVSRSRIPLKIDNFAPVEGPWPVTLGVPFAKETLWDEDAVRVVDANGREVPLQTKVSATWTDGGSIKWLLFDFEADLTPSKPNHHSLEYGRDVERTRIAEPIRTVETAEEILVDSGVLKIAVSKLHGSVIEAAWLDADRDGIYEPSERVIRPKSGQGAYFVTQTGEQFRSTAKDADYSAVVETAGPQRTVIRTRGWYQNEKGERACYFIHRLYVYRGRPEVRLFTTWVITVDTDRMWFRDIGLRLPLQLKRRQTATLGPDIRFQKMPVRISPLDRPVFALQAGRNQGSVTIKPDGEQAGTWRVGGWVDLSDSTGGLTVAVFDMEKQSPTSLEVKNGEIIHHVFSNAAGHDLKFDLEHLRNNIWGKEASHRFESNQKPNPSLDTRIWNGCGMAKTSELLLSFHGVPDEAQFTRVARLVQNPPAGSVDGNYVCKTGVIGPVHPFDPDRFPDVERSISQAFDAFLAVQDGLAPRYDFYDYGMGMPHYVQLPAIRRPVGLNVVTEYVYTGYRREYDRGYGNPIVPWHLFLRSGDSKYWRYGVRFSRHLMDPQTHHWTTPLLKKRVGWVIADFGSWVYDSLKVGFSFNNWMEYLLLNYYITGYERAMDVAVETMDAFYEDAVTNGNKDPYYYCASAGMWLGNSALMYTATWDPRYFEIYKTIEKWNLSAWSRERGSFTTYGNRKPKPRELEGITERYGWREYGLVHASNVPGSDPEISLALAGMGETHPRARIYKLPRAYSTSGHAHLAAYERIESSDLARAASKWLAELGRGMNFSFNIDSGLSEARGPLIWMALLSKAGVKPSTSDKTKDEVSGPALGPLKKPVGLYGRFAAFDFNDIARATAVRAKGLPKTQDFRLEMWVYIPVGRKMITRFQMSGTPAPGKGASAGLHVGSSGNVQIFYSDGMGPGVHVEGKSKILNQWAHVAADFKRDGLLTLYVNGISEGNPLRISSADPAYNIIFVTNDGGQSAGGIIAQAGIYSSLRGRNFSPPEELSEKNAIALYYFDRQGNPLGSGRRVKDRAGNNDLYIGISYPGPYKRMLMHAPDRCAWIALPD